MSVTRMLRRAVTIGTACLFLECLGCSQTGKPDQPGESKQERMPWTVVESLPSSMRLGPGYSFHLPTFSLHNRRFRPEEGSYVCSNLDSGARSVLHRIPAVFDRATGSIRFVPNARDEVNTGLMLGEGDWVLEWAMESVANSKQILVSLKDPRRTLPVKGELPGLGLCNFATLEGGFMSIRTDLPRGMSGYLAKVTGDYRLSVFTIRNGIVAKASSNDPWSIWQGASIPQPPDADGEFRRDGSAPFGAPLNFSKTGRALASIWMPDPEGRSRRGWMEWDLSKRKWSPVSVPGFEDWQSDQALYSGSCLFLKVTKASATLWFVRNPEGRWINMGRLNVLATNGGTHLIVGETGRADTAASIVLVN